MKAVMYHYVRGDTERQPNYYHLDIDDFRRQLDYFEDNFGFVSQDQFFSIISDEQVNDGLPSGVVLTFDDGLRDHYDVVLPELERRGLWGIFYIPTGPYVNDQLLDVHRIHVLLGEVSGVELLEHARNIVDEDIIPYERRDQFREETYIDHNDTEVTKKVKRILNYFVSDKYQTEVLDELVRRVDHDPVNISEFYITESEIRDMEDCGMIVGSHTVNHPVLSKLEKDNQRTEIADSFSFLDDVANKLPVRTFCYPYGTSHTFNEDTINILEEVNCKLSFKVEPSDVKEADLRNRIYALPRYDCNEFPHGSASGSIGPSPSE